MSPGDTRCDYTFRDTCCHSTFDNGSDRVHRSNDLGLELWGDVEPNLLKEVLRGAKAADHKHVLRAKKLMWCYIWNGSDIVTSVVLDLKSEKVDNGTYLK